MTGVEQYFRNSTGVTFDLDLHLRLKAHPIRGLRHMERAAGFCGLFLTQWYAPSDVDTDNFLWDVREAIWEDVQAR